MLKAIIFDVDGTLYESVPALNEGIYDYWVKQVAHLKHLSYEDAEVLYKKMQGEYKSSTRALEVLGLGDAPSIIRQAERNFSRFVRQYVKPDRKLVKLIKKLRGQFSIYTLRNGTKTGTRIRLQKLGFENKRPSHAKGFGPFDDILPTVELGIMKPDSSVFENAIKIIGVPAEEIVVIGDRPEVDLVPAKKVGMKTVWVSWGKQGNSGANIPGVDWVIESIYELEELVSH